MAKRQQFDRFSGRLSVLNRPSVASVRRDHSRRVRKLIIHVLSGGERVSLIGGYFAYSRTPRISDIGQTPDRGGTHVGIGSMRIAHIPFVEGSTMKIATHILLATDFSDSARMAIAWAAELARVLDAKVTVLNVHGHPPEPPEAYVSPDRLVWSSDLGADSEQRLEELRSRRLANIHWLTTATVEDASPDHAICGYANEHDVDLIVLGSHGRTGLAHFFMGSVAEKIVKHAPCPVLVIPPIVEPIESEQDTLVSQTVP